MSGGGSISTAWRLDKSALKKHRSGGEFLATLRPNRPSRESNPRPMVSIAMSSTTTPPGRFVPNLVKLKNLVQLAAQNCGSSTSSNCCYEFDSRSLHLGLLKMFFPQAIKICKVRKNFRKFCGRIRIPERNYVIVFFFLVCMQWFIRFT